MEKTILFNILEAENSLIMPNQKLHSILKKKILSNLLNLWAVGMSIVRKVNYLLTFKDSSSR